MDQRPNVSLENSAKPSKLLALIALVIAFALPFILVKTFSHKQKINYLEQHSLSLEKTKHPTLTEQQSISQALPTPIVSKSSAVNKTNPKIVVKPPAQPAKPIKRENLAAKKVGKPIQSITATAKTIGKSIQSTPPVQRENDLKIVKTRPGDSLTSIFNRLGLSRQTLQTIIRDNPHTNALSNIKANQDIQLLIKKKILEQITLPYSSTQYLVIYRDGRHYRKRIHSYKTTSRNHYITATVRGSLFNTAKRYNVPSKLIKQMTEIFTWDINFVKDIRAGDQFTILYKALYINDKLVDAGDIVAVSYRNRGKTFQAVQHVSRNGRSDYYTPQGKSLKKAFIRYPLRFSHISSTFSLSRYHPLLRYRRPHKGIDLAASIGTPILATGDGRIEIIGRQSGYGNMIKIKHNKMYSTIYGHMLRFQKGLYKGSQVRRGQVIGYVGQTGLASGPHCHYEFHINRQPRNPTTVDLPRGDSVPARELASFRANTNNVLAQLKLFETGRLANANKFGGKVNS